MSLPSLISHYPISQALRRTVDFWGAEPGWQGVLEKLRSQRPPGQSNSRPETYWLTELIVP